MKRKYLIYDDLNDEYYSTNSYELFVLYTGYPKIPQRIPRINPNECQSKANKETWKNAMKQGQHILDCGYRYESRWVKGKNNSKWKRGRWIKKVGIEEYSLKIDKLKPKLIKI